MRAPSPGTERGIHGPFRQTKTPKSEVSEVKSQQRGEGLTRRELMLRSAALAAASSVGFSAPAHAADLSALRSTIRGRVYLPGDGGFDRARTPWRLSVNPSVLAVAEVADVDDAAALVGYAGDNGLSLTAQLTGHGASNAANGTILVRTHQLNDIDLDPHTGLTRVGAGVRWRDVQSAGAPLGLTGVAGSSPGVGVAGYTLGGGLSWFSRAYGWAASSVRAFEIVDAREQKRRVTADSDPDLFWALRGGGGDYALATALEFSLQPAPVVYGGHVFWTADKAVAVFTAFREITAEAPDELTVWCARSQFPGTPATVGIYCAYLGDEASARKLMRPLDRIGEPLSDTRRVLSVDELGSIAAEPEQPSPAVQQGTLIADLNDDVITKLVTEPLEPLLYLQIRHVGGELSRPTDTASGALAAPYFVQFGGAGPTPESETAIMKRTADFLDVLASVNNHRTPFNFLAPAQTVADAFDGPTLVRLRTTKQAYDPKSVFCSNFPVTS
jgi:hypothetical protein